MARKDGKDRGIFERKDRPGWWVQVFVNGRARTYRCDTKTQAKALYGRLKAEIREKKFFPEQLRPPKTSRFALGFAGIWMAVRTVE